MFQNLRANCRGGDNDDFVCDPVKFYILFNLRLFAHYFKDLEYLAFGCHLIYIIYLSIIIATHLIERMIFAE